LAIDTAGVVAKAGQAIQVYGAVFAMIINTLLAVLVAAAPAVVVGLGTGIARLVTAFVLALLGFGAISVANHVLISLLG